MKMILYKIFYINIKIKIIGIY